MDREAGDVEVGVEESSSEVTIMVRRKKGRVVRRMV